MPTDDNDDFEYREWMIRVGVTNAGKAFSGRADLYHKGEHKWRVVLSSLDPSSAQLALCIEARDFIDAWHEGHAGLVSSSD
jgi:hypothetical protein